MVRYRESPRLNCLASKGCSPLESGGINLRMTAESAECVQECSSFDQGGSGPKARDGVEKQLTQDDPKEKRDGGKRKRPGISLDDGRARGRRGEEEERRRGGIMAAEGCRLVSS